MSYGNLDLKRDLLSWNWRESDQITCILGVMLVTLSTWLFFSNFASKICNLISLLILNICVSSTSFHFSAADTWWIFGYARQLFSRSKFPTFCTSKCSEVYFYCTSAYFLRFIGIQAACLVCTRSNFQRLEEKQTPESVVTCDLFTDHVSLFIMHWLATHLLLKLSPFWQTYPSCLTFHKKFWNYILQTQNDEENL